MCGLRIADADPQLDPRTDSERIFLFRGRDVAIAMNSVKILHAVRSAITAIAELLVITYEPFTHFHNYSFIVLLKGLIDQ